MPEKAGLKNQYTCSRGHSIVTVNKDEGTTTAFIRCRERGCGKTASSAWYDVDQTLEAAYEWFKPSAGEIAEIKDAGLRDHIQMGGLCLRKIGGVADV